MYGFRIERSSYPLEPERSAREIAIRSRRKARNQELNVGAARIDDDDGRSGRYRPVRPAQRPPARRFALQLRRP